MHNIGQKSVAFIKKHWGKLLLALLITYNYKYIYAVITLFGVAVMYLPLHQNNYPVDELMKQQRTEFIGKEIILTPMNTLVKVKNYGGPDIDRYMHVFYGDNIELNIFNIKPEFTIKLDMAHTFKVVDVGYHRSAESYFYCVLKSLTSPEMIISERCLDLDEINNLSKDYLKVESVLKNKGKLLFFVIFDSDLEPVKPMLKINTFQIYKIENINGYVQIRTMFAQSLKPYYAIKESLSLMMEDVTSLNEEEYFRMIVFSYDELFNVKSKKTFTEVKELFLENEIPLDISKYIDSSFRTLFPDRWAINVLAVAINRIIIKPAINNGELALIAMDRYKDIEACIRPYFTNKELASNYIDNLKMRFSLIAERRAKFEKVERLSNEFPNKEIILNNNVSCGLFSPPLLNGQKVSRK